MTGMMVLTTTESARTIQEVVKPKSPTVDIQEVSKHSNLSETWWDSNGPMRPLHSLNQLRVQFIRDGLANVGHQETNPSQPLEGISILDIGCGGGILTEALARIGARVTGIDPSSQLISAAKKHAEIDSSLSNRINYLETTIENLSNANVVPFDVVVPSEVLEHVADHDEFLKYCSSALKPGGSIFITTINKTFSAWIGGILAAEYLLKLLPIGTHDWNKFISPQRVKRILEKHDCRTLLMHGMIYNPLTNDWHWSSFTGINYAIHAVKKHN